MRSTVRFPGRANKSHPSTCVSTRSLWLCYFRNLVLFQQQRQQQQQGRSYTSQALRSSAWSPKDRQSTRQWLLTDHYYSSYLIQPSNRARSTLSMATAPSSSPASPKESMPSKLQQTTATKTGATDTAKGRPQNPAKTKTMLHPRWFNTRNDMSQQLQQLKAHRRELDDVFIFKTLRSLLYNVTQYKPKSAWMIYEAMVELQVVSYMRANHYGYLLNIIKYAPNAAPQLMAIMKDMKLAEKQGHMVMEGRHYSQIMYGMSRQADATGLCDLLRPLVQQGTLLETGCYTSLALAAKRQGHAATTLAAAELLQQVMRQGVFLEQRACSVMIAALSVDMDAVTRFLTTMKVTGNLVTDDDDDDLVGGGDGSSPMATSSTEAPEATTTTQQPMKFNVHIYTSLISGMARKGNQVNARRLWEEMRKNGVRPTTATYTAMVEAYGRAGNIKAAMSLLKKYTYANKGQLNKVMATSVLVNAIRHNHMSQAQELLSTWANKMGISVDKKMDPEFWSAVIWVKVLEDIELARDFYGSLYDHNPDYVDAVMVNHLVNGSSEVGRPEKVLDTFALHQYIPSSSRPSWEKRKTVHRPDPISPHYFLVDSLFRCRDVPAALSAMVVMRKHAVPDDITMAMVIRGLVMNGENDLAWRLFLKLKSRGLEPTIQAYTSIIKACIHGAHRGAKKQPATQGGDQQSIIPSSLVESSLGVTNSSAASGLISNKKIGPDQAYLLFRKMTGFHKPNAYTYTTLISCFAKHNIGRAVAIFTHMCNDGVEPVMETYVSLLQGCAIFRNAPLALMVFKHMQEQKKATLAPNNQVLHYLLKSLVRARMDKKDIDRFGDLHMDSNGNKRPRLDTYTNDSISSSPSSFDPSASLPAVMATPMTIDSTSTPFSAVLTNLGRQTKHQLSDTKLIVYDLKVDSPSLPEGYEIDAWNRLQEAVYAIQGNSKPSESLEALYQICENLCQHDHSQQIYNNLKQVCKDSVGKMFAALESDPSEATTYLKAMNVLWTTYSAQMNQIRCIFLYLDRSYRSLLELANELFCDCYQGSPSIREKVIGSILDMIALERNDTKIDTLLLKNSLRMLMDLNLYSSEFEGRFFDQTRLFYKAEGDRLIEEMDMSAYLDYVAKRVHQESTLRMKHYFDKSSKAAITTIVEDQLLSDRIQVILDKSFSYFMDTRQEDDLSLLYRLLKKVDKLDICARYFVDYVKTKGTFILKDHSTDKDLFAILLSFIRKVNTVVRHSFEEDELFLNGCKDSIAYFINLRQNNATKLLANYTDLVLRNDKVDEKALDTCMTFFRILQSKDAFEMFYKQDLAKRLILDVGSNKMEKAMLARMKKDSGPAYTSKLEKMLRDMKYSSDLMTEFKEQHGDNINSTLLHLEVNVLTYGFWPSYTPINVTLPRHFQLAQDEYNAFYTNKYPKRRLTWQNALSVCEVESNYHKGTHNITLTLLQTVILLIFNDTSRPGFSFGEILAMTNLDELELRRTLKSLACGHYALLLKQPAGLDVEPTDYFMYNTDFESTDTHISLNTEKLNEAIENNASIDATVLIPREQQVDAAIVRILKAKQSTSHGALLGEVTRQIRFPATAPEVKQRIELLIEKEYIERTDDGGYRYT